MQSHLGWISILLAWPGLLQSRTRPTLYLSLGLSLKTTSSLISLFQRTGVNIVIFFVTTKGLTFFYDNIVTTITATPVTVPNSRKQRMT